MVNSVRVEGVDDLNLMVAAADLFEVEIAGVIGWATFNAEAKLQVVIEMTVLLDAADCEPSF